MVCNGCSVDLDVKTVNTVGNLASAANRGISEAQGEYIIRVDADDFVDSHLIEMEEQYLDDHPEVDCVWCDYLKAHKHTEGEDFEVFLLSQSPQLELEHACGAMFRKSVWEELGGYDESLNYQEAFDFWCRFYEEGYKSERLETPLYLYRRGHESMSTDPERDEVREQLETKYALWKKET